MFKQDFGTYVKDLAVDKQVLILESFVPLNFVLFPNNSASITANINGMLATFDFDNSISKIFIQIFKEFEMINMDDFIHEIAKQKEEPVVTKFQGPFLLRIDGVVLNCELDESDRSVITGEEFIPLIIKELKIVQNPHGSLIPWDSNLF